VALRWACSPRTVYQLAEQGRLGCVRFSRRMVRFSLDAVEAFEQQRKEGDR
jgi:excisionase family DNA binding protein